MVLLIRSQLAALMALQKGIRFIMMKVCDIMALRTTSAPSDYPQIAMFMVYHLNIRTDLNVLSVFRA